MITAMSLTNGTLTVILDNGAGILTARNDHPKWKEIVDAFTDGNEVLLQSLISLKAVVETYSVGELSVNSTGVTFRGQPMHTVDSDRVMACLRDGLPYKPIANYIARKMRNPSARAILELYNFLEHKNMPITPDGKIIAYKGVQNDFYSVTGNKDTIVLQGHVNEGGHILNSIGSTIEVERSSVDDDFRNGCSFGLHAGSLQYATGFGQRTILVAIDPADVVSVPDDCNCQKLRCCKYDVIGEYTGPLPANFTDEFSDQSEPDECECGHEKCLDCDDTPSQAVPNEKNTKSDILNRVFDILGELIGIGIDKSNPSLSLEAYGMDSLDAVEFVMALEEQFNIEIPEQDAEKYSLVTTVVSDVVDYIYKRITPAQNQTVVTTSVDLCEDAFESGRCAGTTDRSDGKPPKYLVGDELGGDSDLHTAYIRGYLAGY